jgi:hypothetical protein
MSCPEIVPIATMISTNQPAALTSSAFSTTPITKARKAANHIF